MTKDIVIQLFLDLEQFGDIKAAADVRRISYSNNSELIRKILFDYTKKIYDLNITAGLIESKTAGLKEQCAQKDAIIEQLRSQIHKLNQELEIEHSNLALAIKRVKK